MNQINVSINNFEISPDLLNQCIHCGLCLQSCPTYRILGFEMDSPRGRIALMKAATNDRLNEAELNDNFRLHIDLCLACRACETACPSGVQYGRLIEPAKIFINQHHKISDIERFIRWLGLRQLLPYTARLKILASILSVYQVSGLQKFVRTTQLLPGNLKAMEQLLPPRNLNKRTEVLSAISFIPKRGQILFFTGCIQEGFLGRINQATIQVLRHNGYQVIVPRNQTCCGAAHTHLGDLDQAQLLAKKNIDEFLKYQDIDAIVNNAGGCGLALKEYGDLLKDDSVYSQRAREFSNKVFDINEFLIDNEYIKPPHPVPAKAVYIDSCHLRHGQKIIDQPRDLLRSIPELELVELENPDQCCGSAGVYNIAHPELAGHILKAKMDDIAACEAQLIITSNTGCHLQLLAGVNQFGSKAKVLHIMEVLAIAYAGNLRDYYEL